MNEWAERFYERILPQLSSKAVREFEDLAEYDHAEFYATLIIHGIKRSLLTEEDKDHAVQIVRTVPGISFRKIGSFILEELGRE